MRLERARTALAPRLFADFYRFGEAKAGSPMVCWWDGAITTQEYERERRSTPDSIVRAFTEAAGLWPLAIDLLVFPVPEVEPCSRAELHVKILHTLSADVLPSSPNPEPGRFGFVGYSVGGYMATALAVDVPRSRALAVLGGVGKTAAINDVEEPRLQSVACAAFVNDRDPCSDETFSFRDRLAERGIPLWLGCRAGSHDLADYAANGALRSAFAFVLHLLRRPSASHHRYISPT